MKCITSPALDNVEIAMYVDGEAEESVVAHISQCPYCSERARQWTQLQNRLKKQSYRATCPMPIELGDYHLRLLSAPDMLVISQHLRECPFCRQEVATLENFLHSLDPDSSLLGAAKVLIARIVGGQPGDRLAPALRGDAKGPLTFEADGIVILLDIQPANDGKVHILGQVAADDQDQWTGSLVELRREGQLQFSTEIDDLGAFRFEGAMPGTKELQITSKDKSLIVVSILENSS